MRLIKKAYQFFFIIGIFLLPFNSEIPSWMGFLGEYSKDSSSLFFLASFCFLSLYGALKGKVFLPIRSTEFSLFVMFVIIILFSIVINITDIISYYFKQTSGIERFVRQFISIVISGFAFLFVFINLCRDYGVRPFFELVRRTFLISFIIVFACGFIEYLVIIKGANSLKPLLEIFNHLPFVEIKLDYRLFRVSSVTYEPPALGAYIITISGFMFSYIISSPKKIKRFLPFVLLVFLALISKSRTVFIVIIFQIIVGVYYTFISFSRFRTIFIKAMVFSFFIGVLGLVVYWKPIVNSFDERMEQLDFSKFEYSANNNSMSNKSRLGIQVAMFEVFKQNPLFGVGWGQQTFESRHHYPKWALKNNYEFPEIYQNEKIKSFPPGYNMYLRVLAEAGILGFCVFLTLLVSILLSTKYLYYKDINYRYISIALMINFVGWFLNWLQIDTFRVYGFWLSLAMLIILKAYTNNRETKPE